MKYVNLIICSLVLFGCATGELYVSSNDSGSEISDGGTGTVVPEAQFELSFPDSGVSLDSGSIDAEVDSGTDSEIDAGPSCEAVDIQQACYVRRILREAAENRANELGCGITLSHRLLPELSRRDLVYVRCCLDAIDSAMDCTKVELAVEYCGVDFVVE